MPYFRFNNDLYGIDLDSNFIAGLKYNVRRFEGITSNSATVTEERLIGANGTNVLGVAVNGREISVELAIVDCAGNTNDCASKLALFFGVGNKIRIHSDTSSLGNMAVFLDAFVSKFDIARYGTSLKNVMVVSLEMYCPCPYWAQFNKIKSAIVRRPVTYSVDYGGYILFEYECNAVQSQGDVPMPIMGKIDFTDEWASGKTQVTYDAITLTYAKFNVYPYGKWRFNRVEIKDSFPLNSTLTFDTDFNHPFCFKANGVPISSFYEQPYMPMLPTGACIVCVAHGDVAGSDVPDIRVSVGHNYKFI